MDLLVKQASALSAAEKAALGITGIPNAWPIESFPYTGGSVPSGYTVMSDADLATLKTANQAAYDAWLQTLRPVTPAVPSNARNEPIVEMTLRVGKPGTKGMSICTPLFNDKTTWYQRSVQVVDGALDANLLRTEFSAPGPWINIRHPALFYNEFSIPKRDGSFAKHSDYDIVVKKNGVVQTSGFTIDHAGGKVVFDAPLLGTDAVTATYWHLNNVQRPSEWLLVPPAGYKYVVEHVEINVSKDLPAMADTLRFEIWAGAVLAGPPKAVNVAGYDAVAWHDNAFGDPRVPLSGYGQHRSRYRNLRDIINACNEGQGVIPAMGGNNHETVILPFNYLQAWVLDSAFGTLFRLITEQHNPIAPASVELCTATFYLQLSPSEK